jgi:hypothetical protein
VHDRGPIVEGAAEGAERCSGAVRPPGSMIAGIQREGNSPGGASGCLRGWGGRFRGEFSSQSHEDAKSHGEERRAEAIRLRQGFAGRAGLTGFTPQSELIEAGDQEFTGLLVGFEEGRREAEWRGEGRREGYVRQQGMPINRAVSGGCLPSCGGDRGFRSSNPEVVKSMRRIAPAILNRARP